MAKSANTIGELCLIVHISISASRKNAVDYTITLRINRTKKLPELIRIFLSDESAVFLVSLLSLQQASQCYMHYNIDKQKTDLVEFECSRQVRLLAWIRQRCGHNTMFCFIVTRPLKQFSYTCGDATAGTVIVAEGITLSVDVATIDAVATGVANGEFISCAGKKSFVIRTGPKEHETPFERCPPSCCFVAKQKPQPWHLYFAIAVALNFYLFCFKLIPRGFFLWKFKSKNF